MPEGDLYQWDPKSTYIKLPPYFDNMPKTPPPLADVHGARVLANPEISDLEGEEIREEGCLSVRGPFSDLARALRLKARGSGLDGQPIEFVAEGLLARILQHECDHLDGTLFIDRLSLEARREVMRELREQELRGPGPRAGTARGS